MINLEKDLDIFDGYHSKIFKRVKTPDSIINKIDKYVNKNEKGKIPICKCLNDIFGIRIVQDADTDIEEIKIFLNKKVKKFKCIDSSKGSYKATHVYFINTNYDFQWELQIWKIEDEINNINSHALHKQNYTEWFQGRG